eukprot:TRINITY_DN7894_c1_g1_i1.p1 TRINITY_DN7894_c1_g1~~TRINITY_DN7894_c1_g1_i1.p1  ORF type:complete len:182 (-),score=22.57 TRINITY_DN7894_c1_g1_i1:1252-1797(-)
MGAFVAQNLSTGVCLGNLNFCIASRPVILRPGFAIAVQEYEFRDRLGRYAITASCRLASDGMDRSSFAASFPSTMTRRGHASESTLRRAIEVSGPGSIDSPLMLAMREKIMEALETADVVVEDASGDGRHVSIKVVASVFEGKRSVERQRMVYKAIWEELQEAVHAVDSLTTKTPEEVQDA